MKKLCVMGVLLIAAALLTPLVSVPVTIQTTLSQDAMPLGCQEFWVA